MNNLVKKGLLSSLLIMSSSAYAQQQEPAPLAVVVDDAIEQKVAKRIWVSGTVISRNDANVASEVSGRIEWIAEVGDSFVKGDTLAQIDQQELSFRLLENKANIRRLEARVELLTKKVKRLQKIESKQAASEEALDEAFSEKAMAVQDLQLAKISLQRSERLMALSSVKAPFSGTVVERIQQTGEYSQIGQDLLRIVDTINKEASVRAPLAVAGYVHSGQQVSIKNKLSNAIAEVRTAVPVGDQRSRMMEIRISLEGNQWPLGGAIRAALNEGGLTSAITVHRDALVLRNTKTFVYKVDAEGVAKRIEVDTGIGVDEMISVSGDVKSGDTIVVRGAERLKDGQKVKFDQRATDVAMNSL